MSYRPSLCYTAAGMDACALWRMFIPHLNIRNSRFVFTQNQNFPFDMASECDVIIVQRMMAEGNMRFMQFCRSLGLKVVYDLDDHVWDLPKYNPAYGIFKQYVPWVEKCIAYADLITVSTDYLRRIVGRYIGHVRNVETKKPIPIKVIENYIDLQMYYPTGIEKDPDKVIIGWCGSNSHAGDLWHVWQLLPKLLADYPNVEMQFVGMLPPKEIINNPRVHTTSWCHVSEFAGRFCTWNWDIALAPLEKNPFNRAKSSIKMHEAGALGIPCLATDIDNYTAFCLKKPELCWLLCTSNEGWNRKLRELIENKQRRLELGQAMRSNVEENFSIEKNVWRHQQIIEQVLTS